MFYHESLTSIIKDTSCMAVTSTNINKQDILDQASMRMDEQCAKESVWSEPTLALQCLVHAWMAFAKAPLCSNKIRGTRRRLPESLPLPLGYLCYHIVRFERYQTLPWTWSGSCMFFKRWPPLQNLTLAKLPTMHQIRLECKCIHIQDIF